MEWHIARVRVSHAGLSTAVTTIVVALGGVVALRVVAVSVTNVAGVGDVAPRMQSGKGGGCGRGGGGR